MSNLDKALEVMMANKFDITKEYVFSAELCGTEWAKEFNDTKVIVLNSEEGKIKLEDKVVMVGVKRSWCKEVVENGFNL